MGERIMLENILNGKKINFKSMFFFVYDIYKLFVRNQVLKGIIFDVFEGEVLVLIGGNGVGKSILMKIIMCIYRQDKGDIYVDG